MYRQRGGVGSRSEVGPIDRKRINDVLDKQLERSSPSTSRVIKGKDSSAQSILASKLVSMGLFLLPSIQFASLHRL